MLAVDTKTDLKVVVKFLSSNGEYERQLRLHQDLKSEHVVRLCDSYPALRPGQMLGIFPGSAQRGWELPCLVLEYGECSLADYSGRGLLPAIELKATIESLVRITLALHGRELAHCGLQPESFRLYSHEGAHWRLVNLDSVTAFGQPTPHKLPVCFAAPELVTELRKGGRSLSGSALDVWALGVIVWQMFAQTQLFSTETEAMAVGRTQVAIEPPMGCVPDAQARNLIRKMLRHSPAERLAADRILRQAYLAGGLDTADMETSFGPVQKGQAVLRSMLQQLLKQ